MSEKTTAACHEAETAPADFDLVIQADGGELRYWSDVWSYRELLLFLSWRDILVRYKQTAIGLAWSLIRPLLTMAVFTAVFGKLARFPSDGVPYPILVLAALLPWQFFSNAVTESSSSLIANTNLLTKVYFPRVVVPMSAVLVSLVDFLISGLILFALAFWYRLLPDARILALPLFLLLGCLLASGCGLWLSALNVKYRDFRYVVPFLIQFGLYISPIGYSSSVIPGKWRLLYSLNPMVSVIDGFRWAIVGQKGIFWPGFLLSSLVALALFVTGVAYFRATERSFADLI